MGWVSSFLDLFFLYESIFIIMICFIISVSIRLFLFRTALAELCCEVVNKTIDFWFDIYIITAQF